MCHSKPKSKERSCGPRPKDRKSTRLNSSHSQISYAVFCLKKKYIFYSSTPAMAMECPAVNCHREGAEAPIPTFTVCAPTGATLGGPGRLAPHAAVHGASHR